ncbi:MAG: hypothetical protein LCH84_07255 [Gemmatimonadetes bacterium]|nr:hypothetical protein [Gemmatimonadota bacterium]
MEWTRAQDDVRRAYLDGAPGMLVSGTLWVASAAIAQRGDVRLAMIVLFVGGMFIFPVSAVLTRLLGGAATLPKGHPMTALAMQSAFIMPFGWPLVVAAGMARPAWYFAGAGLLVAVHYFPFITLYGMRLYGVLAGAIMLAAGAALWWAPASVSASAWTTGLAEVIAGGVTLWSVRQRARTAAAPMPA